VEVTDLANGTVIATTGFSGKVVHLDFVSDTQLLVVDHTSAEVRKFATGQVSTRITFSHCDRAALSPGRNYLVTTKNEDWKLVVHDVKTGKPAGELVCPVPKIEALSLVFSPDGEELACFYQVAPTAFRIVSFSMATGQPLVNHQYADPAVFGYDKAAVREGHPALDWLPDRGGWITKGQSVFDYKTGLRVHKMPDPEDHFPRVAVTPDRVAAVGVVKVGRPPTLRLLYYRLPREEMAAELAKAQRDKNLMSTFPSPRAPQTAQVRRVAPPTGALPNRFPEDRARKAAALLPAALPLYPETHFTLDAAFTPAETGQAVFLHSFRYDPSSNMRHVVAKRYDVKRNQHLGKTALFQFDHTRKDLKVADLGVAGTGYLHAEVSTDGARLALRRSDERNRLDLWDLAGDRHLGGWHPHGTAPVEWFDWLDASRLITAGGGEMTVWEVDGLRALATFEKVEGTPTLTPGRKAVAFVSGSRVVFADPVKGECLGQLNFPGKVVPGWPTLAFEHDGQDLAGLLMEKDRPMIVHWSANAGSPADPVHKVHAPQLPHTLQLVGANNLLAGGDWYDWRIPYPLCRPMNMDCQVRCSPDGRLWSVRRSETGKDGYVMALDLAQGETGAYAGLVAVGNVKPVFAPGQMIQVSVQDKSGNNAAYTQQFEKALTDTFGMRLGQGGLVLSLKLQGFGTGNIIEYRNPAGQVVRTEPQMRLGVEGGLYNQNGGLLHKISTPFEGAHFVPREGLISMSVWENLPKWVGAPLPLSLYWVGNNAQVLPAPVSLRFSN
jgi:hypothetical protein